MVRRWFAVIALLHAPLWATLTSRASGETPINSYTAVALGDPGGGNGITVHALNDAGQVVGGSRPSVPLTTTHAFLWENGVMSDLGTLGGADSEALAVSNAGSKAML